MGVVIDLVTERMKRSGEPCPCTRKVLVLPKRKPGPRPHHKKREGGIIEQRCTLGRYHAGDHDWRAVRTNTPARP